MKKIIKQPFFYVATASFILLLLMVCNYIFGWTTPTQAPPNANLSAPLNVSATNQSKIGALSIGTSTPPVYTLDLYGQLKSYVAQGTAPFIVTSTTTVTNLNADLLDGYHAADIMAAGGGLKVYKSDGTTVLGNFLGCFNGTNCADGCTGIAYSDVTTGAVTVLGCSDCGTCGNPAQARVYFGDTNCAGLAVSLSSGYITDGFDTYYCKPANIDMYTNSGCTYKSYRDNGTCINVIATNWDNLNPPCWWGYKSDCSEWSVGACTAGYGWAHCSGCRWVNVCYKNYNPLCGSDLCKIK